MLATERDRKLVVIEQAGLGGEEFGDDFAEAAIHGVNGGQRVDANFLVRFELKLFVIEFEIAAGCQDRCGAIAGALLVRSGALERHRENNGARGFIPRIFIWDTAEVLGRYRRISAHGRFMRPWEVPGSPPAGGISSFDVTCGGDGWQKNKA